jgi:hypothetical protein
MDAGGGVYIIKPPKVKKKNTGADWIFITVAVIIITVLLLIIFLYVAKLLHHGTGTTTPGLPVSLGCPTSPAPTSLVATEAPTTLPAVDLAWDPVLTATTAGQTILGYNIYFGSVSPLSLANSTKLAFVVPPEQQVDTVSGVAVKKGVLYHFAVSTVDTCGESTSLSNTVSITLT